MLNTENSTVRFENFTNFKYLNTAFQFLFLHSLPVLPATLRIYSDTTIPENIQQLGPNEVTRYRFASIDSQLTDNPSSNVEIHCTSVFSPDHTHKKIKGSFAELLVDTNIYLYLDAALTRIFEFAIETNLRNIVINTTNLTQLEHIQRNFQGDRTDNDSAFSYQYLMALSPNGIIQLPGNQFFVVNGKYTDAAYMQFGATRPARVIQQSVKLYSGLYLLQIEQWSQFGYSRDERGYKWTDNWDDYYREEIKNKLKPIESFELYSLAVGLL